MNRLILAEIRTPKVNVDEDKGRTASVDLSMEPGKTDEASGLGQSILWENLYDSDGALWYRSVKGVFNPPELSDGVKFMFDLYDKLTQRGQSCPF